jgi:DNA-binding PadR family transcriptional regulator
MCDRHEHARHPGFGGPRHRERRRYGQGRHFGRGGPRARRGDIKAAVLALLGEKPMHGYEMIKEIEERSGGLWRPSAGSIYPTLQLLEESGLISGAERDGKREFSLTEEGRRAAGERSGPLPWEQVSADADQHEVRLRESFFALRAAVLQVGRAGTEDQSTRAREALDAARREVYSILAEDG